MFGVKNIHSFLLLAGTIMALASGVESYLNCESPSSIEAAYKACLHEQGIDVWLVQHQSASLEDALMTELADEFCSQPRHSYQQAMECIAGVTLKCMPEDYQYLLPEPRQWAETISRICDHRQELDLQCAARQSHNSQECGRRKAHEFMEQRGMPSKEELRCWVIETEFDCVLDQYTDCNCQTAKVYSDIVLDILMPSSCAQKRRLEGRRLVCEEVTMTWSVTPKGLMSTTSALLQELPDDVTADCTSVTALKGSIVECFVNEKIRDDELFDDFKNSASPATTVIETLFLHYGDSACGSQRLRYKEAFKCSLQLLRDCTPASFQKFLPSVESAPAHIDYLCEHRKEIDLDCASRKNTALQTCAKRKAMNYVSNGGSTYGNELLCFAFRAGFECCQEVYKACGCDTARIYSDMSLQLHYPQVCPREELESKRLHCQNPYNKPLTVDHRTSGPEVTYDIENSQCSEMKKQEKIDCYLIQGFDFTSLGREMHIFYGSLLDTVMNENDMCSRMDEAEDAVRCEGKLIQYCIPPSDKAVFQSSEKLVEVFKGLCRKSDDIDGSCAYQQLSKFIDCLRSTPPATFRDVSFKNQRSCSQIRQLGDCAKDVLLTCGCPTARAYSDVIFDHMLPYACHFSDDAPRHMKCDASNPYTYQHGTGNGNGAGRLPCAVWSLAIALCLARLFFTHL